MRWASDCVLVGNPGRYQDAAGSWHEGEPSRAHALCNVFSLSASEWSAGLQAGMRPEAEIQLRACDYAGQPRVEMGGASYTVVRAKDSGEWVRLVLERQVGSGGRDIA